MNITYAERKELEEVSKQVFGKASWAAKHLVNKGVKKTKTELTGTPNESDYKYFHTVESMITYMRYVETVTKELVEQMKAEANKNDISK